jgi:uncharacterized protein
MGKVIFWIVLVFGVLFGLRLYNAAKARRRADLAQRGEAPTTPPAEAMVRCARCGVYLPRADAKPVAGGFQCGDAKCVQHL